MSMKDYIESIIKEEVRVLKESDYERIQRVRDSGDFRSPLQNAVAAAEAAEEDEEEGDATAGMSDEDIARLAAQYASEAEFDEIYQESKGRNSHQISAPGHDTAQYAGAQAAHQAVVDAGAYERPPDAMARVMRTIAQAARGLNLSPTETLKLAQSMLDADMLTTAETDPTGSLEEGDKAYKRDESPSDPPTERTPLQGQELLDALASDISDMFKDINGIRPRHINFDKMSLEDLEAMHDRTTQAHKDWWYEERHRIDQDDWPQSHRNAEQHQIDIESDRLAAIDAEVEKMKEPESGEEHAKQSGMGRRYTPGKLREAKPWSSFSDTKNLFEGWRKFTKE